MPEGRLIPRIFVGWSLGFALEMKTVAAVQMDVTLGEPDLNLKAIEERAAEAVSQGASTIIFPECSVTGYCFDSLEEALPFGQTVPGPATDFLSNVCRRLDCRVVVGMLEREGDDLFNVAVLVSESGLVSVYRKAHLPFLGVDRFTTPGDRPFSVHEVGGLRIGMNICYDATFPEAARVLMLQGVDLVALPTNWPPGSEPAAEYVINARALENRVYYAAVNRVGVENGFEFIGASRICDPSGRTLAEAPHRNEAILYAEIDPEKARNKHIIRVPRSHEIHRSRDRRPDLYAEVVEPLREKRFRGDLSSE